MGKKILISARVMALIMIAVMTVTYMPGLTDQVVHAASDKESVEDVTEKLPEEEISRNKEKALADLEKELGIEDEADSENEQVNDAETSLVAETDSAVSEQSTPRSSKRIVLSGVSGKGFSLAATGKQLGLITVTGPNKSGYITITGPALSAGFTYEGIYVGNEHPSVSLDAPKVTSLSGSNAFSVKVDMKDFSIGYHTVYVLFCQNGEPYAYDYVDYVPTHIFKRASNSLSWYQSGKKNIRFYYGGSTYYSYSGEYLDVYMDYRKSGGKWSKKVYGPVSTSSYTVSKKTGLKLKTTYYVRMMYGKTIAYNGKNYVFTGRLNNYASATKKIKTAYSKPKIKKIKITGTKTIVHKYKVHYANRVRYVKSTGRVISVTPLYHTYKYYYTKYKVTVYLKKKMGIAGVQIKTKGGTVQKSGNKKKYVAKYRVSGKKKGKKIKVSVRCFRSKTYGGFSGWKSKKVKAK